MHYFLIAGETSGDLHGGALIEALKETDPEAVITFIGGDAMQKAAGTQPLIHCSQLAVMGFVDVMRNIFSLGKNLSLAKKAVKAAHPDALILIDYPGFNMSVAAAAFKAGIPVYWFIAPKVWAWKKWRLHDLRRYCRRVFSILPFEPEFFAANGAEATYVGNPSVAEVDALMASAPSREQFLKESKLRDHPLLALMPGSRKGEISDNLPVMARTSHRFVQYRPFIIAAPGIDDSFYEALAGPNIPVLHPRHAVHALVHADAALVTSGTATLETALAGVPQVVLYRSNGLKLAYKIMEKVLDVKYVSLPNLICGQKIIPEQLLHNCTPELVGDELDTILPGRPARALQLEGYTRMRQILGTQDAARTVATTVHLDLLASATPAN